MTGQPGATESEQSTADLHEAESRGLLIVDDDQRFCDRLARAMERRNFTVCIQPTALLKDWPWRAAWRRTMRWWICA